MSKKILGVLLSFILCAVPAVTAAKTYTKIEVLNMYYQTKLSTGYVLDSHTCDFDMETSDLQFYIASAYSDGTIDNAYIKYLGHKYKNLTGKIKSKNKKYYQISLNSAADQSTAEYGKMKFKLNIKKTDPAALSHGTVKVTRADSDDFAACSSEAHY
ncbi:MAG: hypothetical protein ACD_43C00144G0002 [uncultured bacterium]|nr:MAG: hypothetical protein ACD_43C00144G0002 [uncultured bacterium]